MAFAAIGTELGFMRIPVAVCAVLEPDSFKFLELFSILLRDFVAFHAINRDMFAPQGIFCGGVIEFFGWLKSMVGVALGAISRQCSLVKILMTGEAVLP
jgi:hypothetical protein